MIERAAKFIKLGGVVAFPTETVYGLGADASNEAACLKIFQIKGRPTINPLIVHVDSLEHAETIGEFNEDALKLSKKLWPGPLSLVVPLKNDAKIAKTILAGLTTIALRIPSHEVALELIRRSETPIAAPSANPSGYISATSLAHVKEHFANEKDVLILESESDIYHLSNNLFNPTDNHFEFQECHPEFISGSCDVKMLKQVHHDQKLKTFQSGSYNKTITQYGLESTIVDMTTTIPTILRDGFITLETLEMIVSKKLAKAPSLMQIKAPGMMDKHYAPKVPVRLNAEYLRSNEVGLNFANSNFSGNFSLNLSVIGNLIEGAKNLYSMLRTLDNYALLNKINMIAVAPIPEIGIGIAINDRLTRAAR